MAIGRKKTVQNLNDLIDVSIASPVNGQVLVYNEVDKVWENKDLNGTGGASTFLELSDTPSSYSGYGENIVSVKTTEDGLEFSYKIETKNWEF